jgi:hypothetical protein
MIFAITFLILFGSGYCFSQSDKTGLTLNIKTGQDERITSLEKRIAEAGDDFVSLTAEEYDLLLSQPVGTVDGFEALTTTAGGIMVGIGFADGPKIYKTDIQILFPDIPNIGEGEVFVLFDFVKGTNGLDFLDRQSNTESDPENNENDFTVLALDSRTAGSKSYWFGSRYVNLRDPGDGITVRALGALGGEIGLSAISGKVVIHLPTNITGLVFAKGDIGVEKPFAGGVITLKEIKDGNISFQFTGDSKKIYAWNVYDVNRNIIDQSGTSIKNGLYQISAKNPQSVKIYQSEIVIKDYHFVFGNESHSTSEEVTSLQEKKPATPLQTSGAVDTTFNNIQAENAGPVYLDKNDPIFISIRSRAVTDLRQRSDTASTENKLIAAKIITLTKEEQTQMEALFVKSINDYTAQTRFETGEFMQHFSELQEKDPKDIAEDYDIRVQILGGDKYAAEYWEDGIAVNSEEHALARSQELAKRYPDNKGIVKEVRKTYEDVRNSIKAGRQERYTKVLALLYVQEKDGFITFRYPYQALIDSVLK